MEHPNRPTAQAGTLDAAFADAGVQTLDFPDHAKTFCEGMALTPSGQIVVSATLFDEAGKPYYGLARLNPDGSVDKTFGSGGYVSGNFLKDTSSRAGQLIIQDDGAMYMCGLIVGPASRLEQVIAKFNPSGTLNLAFGNNGHVVIPMRIPALSNASAGRISFAQSIPGTGVKDRILFATSKSGVGLITRLNLNGETDADFADAGWKVVQVEDLSTTLRNFIELGDGRVLVYGYVNAGPDNGFIQAYTNKGQIDLSFGSNGTRLLDIQHQDNPLASDIFALIERLPNRLLALGRATETSGSGSPQHALMTGLLSDGKTDENFNEGRPVITQGVTGDLRNWNAGVTVNNEADSPIVTLGQTTGGARRLLTGGFLGDGRIDSTFDIEGTDRVEFVPTTCCKQGSGLLVAGTKDGAVQVIRMFASAVN
ncbi:hypothetical protein PS850_02049 [Pseudomonas fluorescens]|nr:hypothetical protein PS850_02049 [Pseudomonas fluorescens]